MIGILIAVVVLVGAVAVADLLLSFAVIRRVAVIFDLFGADLKRTCEPE